MDDVVVGWDSSAPADAAELREYAHFAYNVLAQPSRNEHGSSNNVWLLHKAMASRKFSRYFAAIRTGRLAHNDWVLLSFRPVLLTMLALVILGSRWWVIMSGPSGAGTQATRLAVLYTMLAGIIALQGACLAYGRARIGALRQALIAGLARRDLLAELHAGGASGQPGADPGGHRDKSGIAPDAGARLRAVAARLEHYLPDCTPIRAWTLPIFMIYILMSLIIIMLINIHSLYGFMDIDSTWGFDLVCALVCAGWIVYWKELTDYLYIVRREHWLLDIYDRYLAEAALTDSPILNIATDLSNTGGRDG